MTASFRDHLPASDDARISALRGVHAEDYLEVAREDAFAGPMIEGWAALYPEPFVGITTAGVVEADLFDLQDLEPGEGAPTAAMAAAARKLLGVLTEPERDRLAYDIDAHEWRSWANPEFRQFDTGLRLEDLEPPACDAVLALIEASLSPSGYELVRSLMRINGFLGHLVGLPRLMNELSYQFAVYGEPSEAAPWGWQLYGHHVALNALVVGDQMVVTPVFLGAEPNEIDEGPHAGTSVFTRRIALAREVMAGLDPDLRRQAVSYEQMVDPAMPPGRVHPGDERHLGGCFQDNRVIPEEGVAVAAMPPEVQDRVRALLGEFIDYLPDGPANARRREIERHWDRTTWSWIGGWGPGDPYYVRIQSPVVIAELDHHCGVFLTNDQAAPFHMHTVLRTPNGNDYGRVLITQHTATAGAS